MLHGGRIKILRMDVSMMEKILEAWSVKQVQEALNIYDTITPHGLTFEDVRAYMAMLRQKAVAAKIEAERLQKQWNAKRKQCPECGRLMGLYPVNSSPKKDDRVEGGYKSMWLCGTLCSGKGCLYEAYNLYSVEEYIGGKNESA
jgi:hypothetical protein